MLKWEFFHSESETDVRDFKSSPSYLQYADQHRPLHIEIGYINWTLFDFDFGVEKGRFDMYS